MNGLMMMFVWNSLRPRAARSASMKSVWSSPGSNSLAKSLLGRIWFFKGAQNLSSTCVSHSYSYPEIAPMLFLHTNISKCPAGGGGNLLWMLKTWFKHGCYYSKHWTRHCNRWTPPKRSKMSLLFLHRLWFQVMVTKQPTATWLSFMW